jgi:hypothetical protein
MQMQVMFEVSGASKAVTDFDQMLVHFQSGIAYPQSL